MASALPPNQVQPKDLTPTSSAGVVPQSKIQLTENEKQHTVVGIALTTVLIPTLRKYVDSKLSTFYYKLVQRYKVNTEQSTLYQSVINKQKYGFKYHDPDKYVINNHDELAKLFMEERMAKHFKGILDESSDASAILGIMGRSSCFCAEEKSKANETRIDVRNRWGHCDMSEWTHTKYLESFSIMTKLVKALPNSVKDKTSTIESLEDWKENGIKLLGKNVNPDLFKRVYVEFQNVMKILQTEKVDIAAFEDMKDKIKAAVGNITEFEKKVMDIETEQLDIRRSIAEQGARMAKLTTKTKDPPMSNIQNRNICFSGREEELETIRKSISNNECKIFGISGLGGIGKTSLALQAAWDNEKSFPGGIYWLTADSGSGDSTLKSSLFGLARRIEKINAETEKEKLAHVVTGYLREQDRCLLVIDNLDLIDSQLVNELVNGSWLRESRVYLLITSRMEEKRLKDFFNSAFSGLTLGSFNHLDGILFLARRTGKVFEDVDARELVLELGGLPLALDQASAYLRNNARCQLGDYINKLRKQKVRILARESAKPPTTEVDKARLTVQTTWGMNMEAIKDEYPLAVKITHILSFLSSVCIPKSIINHGLPKMEDDELADLLSDDFEVEYMIQNLTKLSLFEDSSDDSIIVHRMVQDIIKDGVKKDKACLYETYENIYKVLSYAIEKEENPESVPYMEKTIELKVECLSRWSLVMENTGYFLEEIDMCGDLTNSIFTKKSFIKVLEHASLYYSILNQTDRASFYRQVMNDHMAKIKDEKLYETKFMFPIGDKEKDWFYNLMTPNNTSLSALATEEGETFANNSNEEGNYYFKQEKYDKAIIAYSKALEATNSRTLKQEISFSLCHSFYLTSKPNNCIKQAEAILKDVPDDAGAFMWLALSYKLLEFKESSPVLSDDLYGDLASVFSVLALHFSNNDEEIKAKLTTKHLQTLVLPVENNAQLRHALMVSSERSDCESYLIFIRNGRYFIPPQYWSMMFRSLIIGDMSGDKPVISVENIHPFIMRKNIFINIHFDIHYGAINIELFESPALFVKCSFQSHSPLQKLVDEKQKEEKMKEMCDLKYSLANMSSEEYEMRELSTEERNLLGEYNSMKRSGNANPAVVVMKGCCIMINCSIYDCLGAGVLVLNQEKDVEEPFLYMKECTVYNCLFSGVEARQFGSMVLEGCLISENKQGVSAWEFASNVVVRKCDIFNNKGEGIITKEDYTYDTPARVTVEDCRIHHNQLGMSLAYSKSLDIHNNSIFSNRSWGIALRNANVVSIRQNDIFRNDCGGIRVSLNQFHETVIMGNRIHDHTGPGLIQTILFTEMGEEILDQMSNFFQHQLLTGRVPESMRQNFEQILQDKGPDRESNRAPVISLDNILFNNELHYKNMLDLRRYVDIVCNLCNQTKPAISCSKCWVVRYCNHQCRIKDYMNHQEFCEYYHKNYMHKIELTPRQLNPSRIIENHAKKLPISFYKKNNFLVKVSHGKDYYGLKKDVETVSPYELWIYDEFRNISGVAQDIDLTNKVRALGRLGEEKVYNKRIYLHANLIKHTFDKIVIEVNSELVLHDQGW